MTSKRRVVRVRLSADLVKSRDYVFRMSIFKNLTGDGPGLGAPRLRAAPGRLPAYELAFVQVQFNVQRECCKENKLYGRPPQYAPRPAPCKLTFDLESGVWVMCDVG